METFARQLLSNEASTPKKRLSDSQQQLEDLEDLDDAHVQEPNQSSPLSKEHFRPPSAESRNQEQNSATDFFSGMSTFFQHGIDGLIKFRTEYEKEISKMSSEVRDWKMQCAEKQSELEKLREDANELLRERDREIDLMSEKLTAEVNRSKELEAKLAELLTKESETQKLQTQLDKVLKHNAKLRSEMGKAQAETEKIRGENAKLQELRTGESSLLVSELDDLKAKHDETLRQLNRSEQQVRQLQNQAATSHVSVAPGTIPHELLQKKDGEIKILRARLDSKDEEIKNLRASVNNNKRDEASIKRDIDREAQRYQTELAFKEEELRNLTEQLRQYQESPVKVAITKEQAEELESATKKRRRSSRSTPPPKYQKNSEVHLSPSKASTTPC